MEKRNILLQNDNSKNHQLNEGVEFGVVPKYKRPQKPGTKNKSNSGK